MIKKRVEDLNEFEKLALEQYQKSQSPAFGIQALQITEDGVFVVFAEEGEQPNA